MNFPFLDVDVPRSTSYGVYISQLIRLALVSSNVDDFNTRNKVLTAKLLRQEYSLFLFYPITLEGRRGTTGEFATIPFHLVLFQLP